MGLSRSRTGGEGGGLGRKSSLLQVCRTFSPTWLDMQSVGSVECEDQTPISHMLVSDVVHRFHCLYCHGWEVRGLATSGMLAEGETGSPLTALHLARMNLRFSEKATLYTNGDDQLARDIEAVLATSPTTPMEVEPRHIAHLEKSAVGAEVIVHLIDGTCRTEGFMSHKPTTVLRGNLYQQLGLALTPKGVLQVNALGQTSLSGVFAAGDIAQPFTQAVGTAIASGTAAGAGAPLQIQAELWGQQSLF